jgi:hypothetical protein
MKKIIFTAIAIFGLATITLAQVPNYLPTNGLAGWWPFTGNANDESGNNLNGANSGAILTTDRLGSANSAYSFNGSNQKITVADNNLLSFTNATFSYSYWANINSSIIQGSSPFCKYGITTNFEYGTFVYTNGGVSFSTYNLGGTCGTQGCGISNSSNLQNNWHHFVFVADGVNGSKLYVDNTLIDTQPYNSSCSMGNGNGNLYFGMGGGWNQQTYFNGLIDDIGIWNRALNQQEITDLYNGLNCSNDLTISPASNQLQTGSTAIFNAATSDPSPSYVWQSDLGQGFQTLNNFGNYSGVNTATLNIANVQLPTHTQPIRVITTSGNCIDTSNVAVINILDTCITNVTVYDTLLTTVTDTLVINATITGINPPNNLNTVKVFPNPANTHITIDYGNFASMSGYTLKITNNLGQVVFTSPINQQSSYIDLSTWSGNGIYFVQIIDTQNNTIENRKIVIQ